VKAVKIQAEQMTDKELTIVKEIHRTILELTYLKDPREAILKKRVSTGQEDLVGAVS